MMLALIEGLRPELRRWLVSVLACGPSGKRSAVRDSFGSGEPGGALRRIGEI
ncbi:hypothetical protein GFS60_06200 [Rhodococcus sp. WAY2]|nr:hypothetical protein GFS60_06200 [Rhodococcus sp. WAY2]